MSAVALDSASGSEANDLVSRRAGVVRWRVTPGDGTSSFDFRLSRYNTSGTYIDSPIRVLLATGSLEFSSDVEVVDATKGIVLRSPDGSRWRVTIDNAGTLVRTKL